MAADTLHAVARIIERLPQPSRMPTARAIGRYAAEHPQGSHAVRIGNPRAERASTWSSAHSAGTLVVAIIRDGAVRTVFLRHAWQPFSREEFDVDTLAVVSL